MATNPYVNKVEYGNTTVMDITDTTAEAGDVASGKVFYAKSGARSVGTGDYYSPSDTAETAIDDADYFPYYDSSATAKRKTLWSNIKAKLKSYFDGVYTTSIELTQAQYDALSSAEKHDTSKVYYITDGQGGGGGGYTLPIATTSTLGGIKVDNYVTYTDANGLLGVKPYSYTCNGTLDSSVVFNTGVSTVSLQLSFTAENFRKASILFTSGTRILIDDGTSFTPTTFCFYVIGISQPAGSSTTLIFNTLAYNGSSSKSYSSGAEFYLTGYGFER